MSHKSKTTWLLNIFHVASLSNPAWKPQPLQGSGFHAGLLSEETQNIFNYKCGFVFIRHLFQIISPSITLSHAVCLFWDTCKQVFCYCFAMLPGDTNCEVMLLWITWQNSHLRISRYAILSEELLAKNSITQSVMKRVIKEIYERWIPFTFGINKNLESQDMAWMPWMYSPWVTDRCGIQYAN